MSAKDRPRNVLDAMAHFHHPAPLVLGDGATVEFALPVTVLRSGDLQVFVDGLLKTPVVDYAETDNAAGTFTMAVAPAGTSHIVCAAYTLAS